MSARLRACSILVVISISLPCLVGQGCPTPAVKPETPPDPPDKRVADPVFTPNGGTFIDGQQATITCGTPGATIHYRLARPGGVYAPYEDRPRFTVYSEPFQVLRSALVQAWAEVPGLAPSSTVNCSIEIIPGAPAITPVGGHFGGPMDVSIQARAHVLLYTTDGSAPVQPGHYGDYDSYTIGPSTEQAEGEMILRIDKTTTIRAVSWLTVTDGRSFEGRVSDIVEAVYRIDDSSANLAVSATATPSTISPGQSATLSARLTGGTPPYSYAWSAAGWAGSTEECPAVSPTSTTEYTVNVTDSAVPKQTCAATVVVLVQEEGDGGGGGGGSGLFTPSMVGRMSFPGFGSSEYGGKAVATDGQVAYVYLSGQELAVVDVSVPSAPRLLATAHYANPTYHPDLNVADLDVVLAGNRLVIATAAYTDILDVSNPATPRTLYDSALTDTQTSAWILFHNSPAVAVRDGYAFYSTGGSLQVVDIRDARSPRTLGSCGFPQQHFGSPMHNGVALCANVACIHGDKRLHLVDVSMPANPVLATTYQIEDQYQCTDMVVHNNLVYLICVEDDVNTIARVDVLDVADPDRPVTLGEYRQFQTQQQLRVDEQYLWVVTASQVYGLSTSNPRVCVPVGESCCGWSNLAAVGKYVYLAHDTGLLGHCGFEIWQVAP